jgi:glutamate racemase
VRLTAPTIVIFDSGLGGLTVYQEIVSVRPDADYFYMADDAFFPYSRRGTAELTQRVVDVMTGVIEEHRPDLVVIACNTASTIVLPELRARFEVPFVGTVPAIKPACTTSVTRLVSVLGTNSTVEREYTRGLLRDFAQDCDVALIGSDKLATLAENALRGIDVSDKEVAAEIAPCFVKTNGERTDVVVLACTHFPLLLDRFRRLAPWEVDWIDPAEAIARRVVQLLGEADSESPSGKRRIYFTSGEEPSSVLSAALEKFGL